MFWLILSQVSFVYLKLRLTLIGFFFFFFKYGNSWNWAAILMVGLSGGIIILWDHYVGKVTPIATLIWAFHSVITSGNKSWIPTTIYNSQLIVDHKNLRLSLSCMSSLNIPWLLSGDFNATINKEKHKGSSFKNYAPKSKSFSKFIFKNSLIDLNFIGSHFTWCNDQDGLACRWARLDRFLANSTWLSNF